MKTSTNSIIIAVASIICAFLFANAFKNRNQSNDTISVTGLGKKDFILTPSRYEPYKDVLTLSKSCVTPIAYDLDLSVLRIAFLPM